MSREPVFRVSVGESEDINGGVADCQCDFSSLIIRLFNSGLHQR
jgi:hypothetical protein